MQIFFGTCLFLVAVVMLAYVPGKLLLLLLKRTLTPVVDVTLACILGLVVSSLAYWLITVAHLTRFYLVWPLTTAAAFVWLYCSKRKSLSHHSAKLAVFHGESVQQSRDRSGFALTGVVALGILVFAFLPHYYTNFTWRPDGTMRVCPLPDVLFHVAVANELTHTIPPQAPVFAGYPLVYHYGMDLSVAMFAKATALDMRDLTVRFVPTLFLALSMLSVFCFSRNWLGSGYFGALVVFLVLFGEDFSFIPRLLLGEKVDWSLRYFGLPPILPLFCANPILPGLGLLFAGLFCLERYLRERGGAWLFLTALLFVALIQVKIFIAAQMMCSLALAALVYLGLFRNTTLLRVAACTAISAMPLAGSVLFKNRRGPNIVTKFEPWLYVSDSMEALGIKNRLTGFVSFAALAVPIYLVGCLGMRVIGVPAILKAIFRPDPKSALRFVLAVFVVIGLVIALTCNITLAGWSPAYNPVSATFQLQSNYVAWIFAVEVLQTLYRWAVARGIYPALATAGIVTTAVALSVPATVQHFVFWREPDHLSGHGNPLGQELQNYDRETLSVMDFLVKDAHPGDVVLPGDKLLAPVLALTKCRVPVGYFAYAYVPQGDYMRRVRREKEFWKAWRLGKIQSELLREANVNYVIVNKPTEGIPATIPGAISKVFENSEFAVFQVHPERLSETPSKT
jgi:hypothetical protein